MASEIAMTDFVVIAMAAESSRRAGYWSQSELGALRQWFEGIPNGPHWDVARKIVDIQQHQAFQTHRLQSARLAIRYCHSQAQQPLQALSLLIRYYAHNTHGTFLDPLGLILHATSSLVVESVRTGKFGHVIPVLNVVTQEIVATEMEAYIEAMGGWVDFISRDYQQIQASDPDVNAQPQQEPMAQPQQDTIAQPQQEAIAQQQQEANEQVLEGELVSGDNEESEELNLEFDAQSEHDMIIMDLAKIAGVLALGIALIWFRRS